MQGHDHNPHARHGDHAGVSQTPDTTGGSGSALDLLTVTGWDAALAVGALVALGGLWLVARRGVPRGARPGWRIPTAAVLGLAAATLAASSPVGALVWRGSHVSFMVQLELLMNVVPVLLLLGVGTVFRSAGGSLARVLATPALGLGAWLLVMYASHLPVVHGLVMQSRTAYALLLLAFVVAGALFWAPVVSSDAVRPLGKLGYLALAQAGAGLLAAVLIWSPAPLYAHGHGGTMPFGFSALLDQKLSGAVMMVVDMLVASTVAGWIFVRSLVDAGGTSPAAE